MEPTSEPENRQSRGLARFWPVHGMSTPAPRESEEDPGVRPDATGAAAHTSDQQAGAAGPNGEHPQVSDQQSQPHDDQPEPDEQPAPFAARPHPALTSDTQMVALGSRRPADALLGTNGARWTNQGGFPPVETNGHRNGDAGPRHGGIPIANGQAPVSGGPRSPFAPTGDEPSPFAPPGDEAMRSAFMPADDRPVFGSPAEERPTFGSAGEERSTFGSPGDDRSVFGGPGDDRSAFGGPGDDRPVFGGAGDDVPPGPRSPFALTGGDSQPGARSPFAPADDAGPAGPPFAPSPFAPQASGSASVTGPGQQTTPSVSPATPIPPQQPGPQQGSSQQSAGRPVGGTPSAAGSAQVPMPMPGRPVSTPPAATPAPVPHTPTSQASASHTPTSQASASHTPTSQAPTAQASTSQAPTAQAPAPHAPAVDPSAPTRLEPTGWATAGPRAGASGSASVPVSGSGGRRSRDDEATDEQVAPAPRRSANLDDVQEAAAGRRAAKVAGETPLRPGDVNDVSITFWEESASAQFRAEWHEVKAQFVDDPVAALTRAHDLLTEAVHELTESMLAERDELDPLRAGSTPDTESMRMAMRGYREFLDRILAL